MCRGVFLYQGENSCGGKRYLRHLAVVQMFCEIKKRKMNGNDRYNN